MVALVLPRRSRVEIEVVVVRSLVDLKKGKKTHCLSAPRPFKLESWGFSLPFCMCSLLCSLNNN